MRYIVLVCVLVTRVTFAPAAASWCRTEAASGRCEDDCGPEEDPALYTLETVPMGANDVDESTQESKQRVESVQQYRRLLQLPESHWATGILRRLQLGTHLVYMDALGDLHTSSQRLRIRVGCAHVIEASAAQQQGALKCEEGHAGKRICEQAKRLASQCHRQLAFFDRQLQVQRQWCAGNLTAPRDREIHRVANLSAQSFHDVYASKFVPVVVSQHKVCCVWPHLQWFHCLIRAGGVG